MTARLALLIGLLAPAAAAQTPTAKPRKIYAHYMGCFSAGTGAIQWHAKEGMSVMGFKDGNLDPLKRDIGAFAAKSDGGRMRNFALAPYTKNLTLEESADLEIRRAMRAGFDGFTFDAWAGGAGAMKLLDTMFAVCEAKKYPFELTITLDSSCIDANMPEMAAYTGNKWLKCVKWLLDKHGKSPNLARRDGKPMIMGYQSIWPGNDQIFKMVDAKLGPDAKKEDREKESRRLRWTPEGLDAVAAGYRKMDEELGQPIYWEYCLSAMTHWSKPGSDDVWVDAAKKISTNFPALGLFLSEGPADRVAKAVVDSGAEWSQPIFLQYENYGYFQRASQGTDDLRRDWQKARDLPSTLIQYITWNDYQENTNVSPGYNTRYAYLDLTSYFIEWWKKGVAPIPDHDKVYIFSHKYTDGSKMFPFQAKTRKDNVIEVVTILPKPATIRMPGRNVEWEAPAGYSFKQVPLTAGPVSVELLRSKKVQLTLTSPEPVSDRPFRQDTGKTAISTEDARLWKADFGDEPMFTYSEYGDADNDGLPNWFEMLWFGKFGDMSTATQADPNADPDGDGQTNLQEYLAQTDPTKPNPGPMKSE